MRYTWFVPFHYRLLVWWLLTFCEAARKQPSEFTSCDKSMMRVWGRLVYCPEWHRGQRAGFTYRDIICHRLNPLFCRIVNEKLDDILDWGCLAMPLTGKPRANHEH